MNISAGAGLVVRVVMAVAVLCSAAPAAGADFDYRLSLGAGFSDNVGRSAENEQDESIAVAGVRLALDQESRRVHAEVNADIDYLTYLGDTYDPELIGNVYADATFALVPEHIIWSLTDQLGQVTPDPFEPATPENRENINYFTTGPDFIVGLGTQMRLRVGLRYSLVDYEDDPFDSTSPGGQLGLERVISDRSSISLNATTREVEYDDVSLNADFGQTDVFLRYETEAARTNISIDAGYSQLDREALDDPESGPMLRMDIGRRISPSSILILSGGREFATAAGAFAIDQGAGIGAAPGRQSADPYTLDRATIEWQFSRRVTGWSATTAWSNNSYDDSTLDETIVTLAGRFHRDLSAATSLDIAAAYSRTDRQPPSLDFDDMRVDIGLTWRLSRNLTMEATYDFSSRLRDAPTSEYKENRIMLTIGYGRGDPRRGRRPPTFGVDSLTPAGN